MVKDSKKNERHLCKGKTLKGVPCSRKGSKDGYCHQHNTSSSKPCSKPPKDGSFKFMIVKAINANDEKKGASLPYIKKYLAANYNIDPKNYRINLTIKKMIESSELSRNPKYLGHYRNSKENCNH